MLFPIPPLVISVPAPLPFGIQVAPPIVSFMAVVAMVVDRLIQVCLGFLDRMLAVRPVVGVGLRRSRYKPHKRRCDQGCYCYFSKSLFQGGLLLY
jgi:hypothetical protein